MTAPFRHVAVLGTGLLGGSFALALKRAFPETQIVGWDRPEVLARAREPGAVDAAAGSLAAACRQADLVYIALPVEETIRRLPEIAASALPDALVTDAGSTKSSICRGAAAAFGPPRKFIGGHPIAGREEGGIENADADLFRGTPYVLIGPGGEEGDERCRRFVAVVNAIGARPVWLPAERHDRLLAFLSHLPQLASVALAETVLDGAGDAAATLAGTGLRDALRLAGSPYAVWADICRTSPDLDEALARLIASLEQIRSRLKTGDLAGDFDRASRLYKILRGIE
jgi:prephenate dehydrogenase